MKTTDASSPQARIQLPQQHGVLVLNKPSGPSSARCLTALKRLGQKKIGHAGTLDPMASGVLLVLLGHATKISGHLLADGGKTYRGQLRLGMVTDSWDKEGTVQAELPWQHITEEDVRRGIAAWLGRSAQPVPPISAAKHGGQPLYKLARAGREVPQKVKDIKISLADVLEIELPLARFRVSCSSGTYIRSLAHSLGMRLQCGAVLTELTREYSHPFSLAQAHDLQDILDNPESLPDRVLPVTAALPHWPAVTVAAADEPALRNGRPLPCRTGDACGGRAVLLSEAGTPLALAQRGLAEGQECWTVLRGLWN